MALSNSTSKELVRIISRWKLFRHRMPIYSNYNQIRCLSSIARNHVCRDRRNFDLSGCENATSRSSTFLHKRGFFGCGNGGDENMLSKVYEERQVIGYSPEQLFDVVAAVDMYEDFLPWCQRSQIIRRYPDGKLDAELQIGFKLLVESYISHVELNKPNSIKTTSSQSSLFDHLINVWEFNPGPIPGTCNLHFLVDFKFHSPLYRQIANMFFKEVVSRLVGSFRERCRLIYGPGVPIQENAYNKERA